MMLMRNFTIRFMGNNKETAVEWLVKRFLLSGNNLLISDFQEANQMHKEQIKNAWDRGRYIGYFFPQGITEPEYENNSEEYYNETYYK